MTRRGSALLIAAACGVVLLPALAAQGQRRELPRVSLAPLTGKDSFDRYCATCHGTSGRGDGNLAASLTTRPADLTTLAQRRGGVFPRAEITAYVDGSGRSIPAHGATQMPLWGGIFRWLDTEPRTRVRIANLVAYVESLQAAPDGRTAPPITGPELFGTFCAPCHGASGRGDGPMAGQLTRSPSDLTRLQLRNGGQFPAVQLERIIDGQRIEAHGSRAMPVWGDVFLREQGVSRADVDARIAALVAYLRTIQERLAE
jgi:mono/diheme cytochrome c family protein